MNKETLKISETMAENPLLCAVYLAAMIDAEGSIVYQKDKSSRQVSIYNTEIELINNCKSCLDVIGIKYYVVNTGKICKHGEALQLTVSGQKSLNKLFKNIEEFMCFRKRQSFKSMLSSYKYRMSNCA